LPDFLELLKNPAPDIKFRWPGLFIPLYGFFSFHLPFAVNTQSPALAALSDLV
jgi:hypothetical protein